MKSNYDFRLFLLWKEAIHMSSDGSAVRLLGWVGGGGGGGVEGI